MRKMDLLVLAKIDREQLEDYRTLLSSMAMLEILDVGDEPTPSRVHRMVKKALASGFMTEPSDFKQATGRDWFDVLAKIKQRINICIH